MGTFPQGGGGGGSSGDSDDDAKEILLGMKKRGFGEGKWNGEGEGAVRSCLRERVVLSRRDFHRVLGWEKLNSTKSERAVSRLGLERAVLVFHRHRTCAENKLKTS